MISLVWIWPTVALQLELNKHTWRARSSSECLWTLQHYHSSLSLTVFHLHLVRSVVLLIHIYLHSESNGARNIKQSYQHWIALHWSQVHTENIHFIYRTSPNGWIFPNIAEELTSDTSTLSLLLKLYRTSFNL